MSLLVVTERDEQHMSHEALALGKRIWDLYQNEQLVGIFSTLEEALAYRSELEAAQNRRSAQEGPAH
jgi:hypothetical protein